MNPHRRPVKTALALALALGAIAPAAASARPNLEPAAEVTALPQPAVEVLRVSDPGGFDWGDAGIGAVGGLALSMIGLGGALAVTQRRARPARGSTGAAT